MRRADTGPSGAQGQTPPATHGGVAPLAEHSWFVDDVLGGLQATQQLDGCGRGADPDLDAPGVVVLDDPTRASSICISPEVVTSTT